MRDTTLFRRFTEQISAQASETSTGSSGALAGAMAASLLARVCNASLGACPSQKAQEGLLEIRDRALSLRRDLLALVDRESQAARAVKDAQCASGAPSHDEQKRLRAMLFASEVPLRTAESCNALLNMSLRALGRAGIKSIAEIGTAAALASAGVVGGAVAARTALSAIPSGRGIGAAAARKRAERILREAEALRSQVIDRVRQHLP